MHSSSIQMKSVTVSQLTRHAHMQPRVSGAASQRQHAWAPRQCRRELSTRLQAVRENIDESGEVSIVDQDDADLEAKMEEFLRQQAERDSGDIYVTPGSAEKILGAAEVPDDMAKEMCREVVKMIKVLKMNRDMSINEVKLTIVIEDPRARERRESMGIEDTSGVSRDELALALMEVSEGRIPKDRIALRELTREMREWPFADISNDSRGPAISAGPVAVGELAMPSGLGSNVQSSNSAGLQARRPPKLLGRDKNEKSTGLADQLPDWVGYTLLYGISIIPIVIAGTVVAILFFNSLK